MSNPIKYSDIFDFGDRSVVLQLLKDLDDMESAYSEMAKSIEESNKTMTESFSRYVDEVAQMTKKLNLSRESDRVALLQLAADVDKLRVAEENRAKAQANSRSQGKAAADSVQGLKNQIIALTNEYNKLSPSVAKQATRMKEISPLLLKLKGQQKELTDALKLTTANINYATGSYRELEEATKRMMKQLKEMPNAFDPANKSAQELAAQIKSNNDKLKEFDKTMGVHNRNVGNYTESIKAAAAGLKEFGLKVAAQIFGWKGLSEAALKVIETNVEISDTLSDVERTAELTTKQGNNLVESLKKIDTRTTLKGLVDLTVIGGQLGVKGVKDLAGFAKAIDELSVTLAGEISGGAEAVASSLGKINEVFKVQEKEGTNTEQSLLKTGSAILKLGQAGLATGDFLTDFAERTGAVATQSGIALPTILAYSSTLEELGVKSEVAGTAMNQLITQLAKTPKAFFTVAKAADPKLTLKAFTDLINNDTTQALNKFFEGLNKVGTASTGFNQILDQLHIRGSRSNAVIAALAQNQDLLSTRIIQANKAYADGTLASDQFRLKNDNLAGSIAKIGNVFLNVFVNGEWAQKVADVLNAIASMVSGADLATEAVARQRRELALIDEQMPPLLKKYDDLNEKAQKLGGIDKLTAKEQTDLNTVIQQIAEIMPDSIKAVDQYGNVTDIARGKITGMTDALRENIKLASAHAAELVRLDSKFKQASIGQSQKAIASGTKNVPAPSLLGGTQLGGIADALLPPSDLFTVPTKVDKAAEQQAIAAASVEIAENTKKLKEVLLQDLDPAEQKVYDKFYGNQKRSKEEADALAEANKKAGKGIKKDGEDTAATLKELEDASKRAKTEIEKLQKAVDALKKGLESAALSGKLNKAQIDAYLAAVKKLEDAQRRAAQAILSAIDPYKGLQQQSAILTERLQREIGLNQDTTQTKKELTTVTAQLTDMQNRIKQAIADTIGPLERMNTELDIARKAMERQIAAGQDYSEALAVVAARTKDVEEIQRTMAQAILKVTDPMAYLNSKVDEYRKLLGQQAASSGADINTVMKYKQAIDDLTKAQDALNEASKYDPRDPKGIVAGNNLLLEKNQQDSNRYAPDADRGSVDALAVTKALAAKRLQIIYDSLAAEQDAYKQGSQKWEELETKKTDNLRDQEELRNEIADAAAQKRQQIQEKSANLAGKLTSGLFDIEKSVQDNLLNALEGSKAKELELAGNNAAAQAKINDKYTAKENELKRKSAIADKERALFDIALSTAVGASKAVAEFPLTGGMPFLAWIIAEGALEAALVAAKPIPRYERGRLSGPAEVATVGERGSEALVKSDGSFRMSASGAHLTQLSKGEKVYPAHSPETAAYRKIYEAMTGASSGDALQQAYVGSFSAISSAKYEHEAQAVGYAVATVTATLPARIERAVSDAMKDITVQNNVFDARGHRQYLNTRNASIENMNNRNSMFGEG